MSSPIDVTRIEVRGQGVLSLIDAMALFREHAQKILDSHGLTVVDDKQWYPLKRVLDALHLIEEKIGPNTLKAVGRNIPGRVLLPPNITTVEQALGTLDVAYKMNHRSQGYTGSYGYLALAPRSGQIISDSPYPCSFDEGLLEGVSERFRPRDSIWLRIEHDGRGCRKNGAASCTYRVTW
ncbi:MAG TPA: hypothetical protein VF815_18940 [Myxococcaceae bacterium]|jgi:hypothetical protein